MVGTREGLHDGFIVGLFVGLLGLNEGRTEGLVGAKEGSTVGNVGMEVGRAWGIDDG